MVSVQDISWSADGRRIFFSAMRVRTDYSDYAPGLWSVYRYDLGSGRIVLVVSSAFTVAAAPSGGRILVGKLVDGQSDLFLLDADGHEVERLTDHPADDSWPAWSPDGNALAFQSKRGAHTEIFVADRRGKNLRRLIDTGEHQAYGPAWAPDGQRIAYYLEKGDGKDQVHVVRADGTGDTDVTQDGFNNIFPGWIPDGRIVYGQDRKEGPARAVTVRPEGGGKQPLFAIQAFLTRYAADGIRFAYLAEAQDGTDTRLVIADRNGRTLETVPTGAVGKPVRP